MRNHRFLNSHIVNPANDRLCITVLDEPGPGGANHLYMISGFDTSTNPAKLIADEMDGEPVDLAIKQSGAVPLIFQNGAIGEAGLNGITHEALLAILIDRLESFQTGPYKSNYNADALYHLQAAMHVLHRRTRDRMAQGIEGTMAVGTETRLGANVHGIGPDTDSDEDRSTDGIAAAVESASQDELPNKIFAPDEGDNFLVATVSADFRQIGIDHPTHADWADVLAAHEALRDRLNERIAEQRRCPVKPSAVEKASEKLG